ncbi:MAG: hypothetical protein Q7U56_08850 [Humidesulfovibrio sp.]|nr:hypothetical protein [Humidesulfovibrio sp.]
MTEELPDTIPLRCVFCQSTSFKVPHESYQPQPGEMLVCGNCGRESLYDAMLDVVREEATELASNMLSDMLKKAGFKGK